MTRFIVLLMGIVCSFPSYSKGHPTRFLSIQCEIHNAYTLTELGELEQSEHLVPSHPFITIDTVTGRIFGALGNRDVTIVPDKNPDNGISAYWMTESSGWTGIKLFSVQTWVESDEKPFRATVQSWVYTGLCNVRNVHDE